MHLIVFVPESRYYGLAGRIIEIPPGPMLALQTSDCTIQLETPSSHTCDVLENGRLVQGVRCKQ